MTEPFTSAVKAVVYLRDCASTDPSLRYALAAIAHGHGFKDFVSWAEANPDTAIKMAEVQREILEDEGLIARGMQSA